MSKNIVIETQFRMDGEAWKMFREQVYYIDPSIDKIVILDGKIHVLFKGDVFAEDTLGRITALAERTEKSFRRVKTDMVREYDRTIIYRADPQETLEMRGFCFKTGPGVFVVAGDALVVMQNLDRLFRKYALDLGSVEFHCPTTVPTRSLIDNGYAKSFPQHMIFAAPLDFNEEKVGAFADRAHHLIITPQEMGNYLAASNQVLSPTVCYHCFEALRTSREVPASGLITAVASCHRHESKVAEGLRRLQTFTMREIVMFGSAEKVDRLRHEIMDHACATLEKLDVKYRLVTASDPFFSSGAENKRGYQSLLKLKYELQVYLPYCDEWMAVASFNHHQSTYVQYYQLSGNGTIEQSGCVGYGFERMVFGIFAQKGFDYETWSDELKQLLVMS